VTYWWVWLGGDAARFLPKLCEQAIENAAGESPLEGIGGSLIGYWNCISWSASASKARIATRKAVEIDSNLVEPTAGGWTRLRLGRLACVAREHAGLGEKSRSTIQKTRRARPTRLFARQVVCAFEAGPAGLRPRVEIKALVCGLPSRRSLPGRADLCRARTFAPVPDRRGKNLRGGAAARPIFATEQPMSAEPLPPFADNLAQRIQPPITSFAGPSRAGNTILAPITSPIGRAILVRPLARAICSQARLDGPPLRPSGTLSVTGRVRLPGLSAARG
jgi:hypothetical protein